MTYNCHMSYMPWKVTCAHIINRCAKIVGFCAMEAGIYVSAKAILFGRAWAKETFGHGFTQRLLYGKVVGASDSCKMKVQWEDGEESEAAI